MHNAALERLIWVLIYGGLLSLCLALFLGREGAAIAWAFGLAGVAAALAGAFLVVVRARRSPPAPTPRRPNPGDRP